MYAKECADLIDSICDREKENLLRLPLIDDKKTELTPVLYYKANSIFLDYGKEHRKLHKFAGLVGYDEILTNFVKTTKSNYDKEFEKFTPNFAFRLKTAKERGINADALILQNDYYDKVVEFAKSPKFFEMKAEFKRDHLLEMVEKIRFGLKGILLKSLQELETSQEVK